jgi:hypothetical protein
MILAKIEGRDCAGTLDGTVSYGNGKDCPLARAISRRLKKGFWVLVGGFGTFYIYADAGCSGSLHSGQADNFNGEVVRKYGQKSRSFMRKLDIPAKFVKRTRFKELQTA